MSAQPVNAEHVADRPAPNTCPSHARVDRDFTYHPPKGDQLERYNTIRANARGLAHLIVDLTPASREQSLALTKLEEAVMHANSAIARNG